MVEHDRAEGVARELRRRYFKRWAACALVIWVGLWSLGTIKYGPFGTVVFIMASLASLWLAAWMRATRVAGEAPQSHESPLDQTDADSKKAA
jgi:hypothetical protein